MDIQNLISQGRLEEFTEEIFDAQIKARFTTGANHFDSAKKLFDLRNPDDSLNVIYSTLYEAARIFCQTLLLLNKYKTCGKYHHGTTFLAAKIILADSTLDIAFARFEKMRSRRNTIEYGSSLIEISESDITQAIIDIEILSDKIRIIIDERLGRTQIALD